MINKVIYTILLIGLVYVFFKIDTILRKDFLKEKLTLGTSKLFFLALIFPKKYFKKNKILEGWLLYVLDLIIVFVAFFFFIKLITSLK
jgi:hypothetical protein